LGGVVFIERKALPYYFEVKVRLLHKGVVFRVLGAVDFPGVGAKFFRPEKFFFQA
jgi:hypothetical protein